MKHTIYFVDAFAEKAFEGNPAGVCILDEPMDETMMQNIAAENNLSETAFVVKNGENFSIRWFTPAIEVDLCGHATLASGYILFNELVYEKDTIEMNSKSGILKVSRQNDRISLDFPTLELTQVEVKEFHLQMFDKTAQEVYETIDDYLFVFESEEDIRNIKPDFSRLLDLDCRGVIVTAPGEKVDFVSRFFAPAVGIPEDPVTGSAHTKLIPYWSRRLGKKELIAKQISKRGGTLYCKDKGDRVDIAGKAVLYLKGEINI
ncbi:MAG: PhzF family phenazine biosynthesis protein [Bacteroidetes bacterium]|nr:PhzF family phenazine biosynthesis protein [Bacteroidota bacterium]